MSNPLTPDGAPIVAIGLEEDGTFVNVWGDGSRRPTSVSLEDAVIRRQRARSIATRLFLRRK